jgi:hypothetical protein
LGNQIHFITSFHPLAIDFLRECVCDTRRRRRRRSINEKKESTPAARGEREDGFEVR